MSSINTTPADGDFDPHHIPSEGFSEPTLPAEQRRQHELHAWAGANPDANVIPSTLLFHPFYPAWP